MGTCRNAGSRYLGPMPCIAAFGGGGTIGAGIKTADETPGIVPHYPGPHPREGKRLDRRYPVIVFWECG